MKRVRWDQVAIVVGVGAVWAVTFLVLRGGL